MSVDLKKIRKGKRKLKERTLIYGPDGIGKTTFAAAAPNSFIIDANKGSHNLDVQGAVDVSNWDEMMGWIVAVANGQVPCDNVVLDAVSDLEAMNHTKLFPGTTITEYKGGYGKGDEVVLPTWRELIMQLEKIYFSGKGIIIVGHSRVRRYEDPMGPGYDRYELACRPNLAGLLRQWVDFVLFAQLQTGAQKTDSGASKGITTGARYIHTRRTAAYDAKARGSLYFPERLPLSWHAFHEAVARDEQVGSKELEADIVAMLAELGDSKLDTQVREWLKAHPENIVESRNRVAALLEEERKKRSANVS